MYFCGTVFICPQSPYRDSDMFSFVDSHAYVCRLMPSVDRVSTTPEPRAQPRSQGLLRSAAILKSGVDPGNEVAQSPRQRNQR